MAEDYIAYTVPQQAWAEICELYHRGMWELPKGRDKLTFAHACMLYFRLSGHHASLDAWVIEMEQAIFLFMADEFA